MTLRHKYAPLTTLRLVTKTILKSPMMDESARLSELCDTYFV